MSSMSEAGFVQSLLLATPLYFYYQHLAPPGYFSGLLRALVQLHKQQSEQAARSLQEDRSKISCIKRKYDSIASDASHQKDPGNNKRSKEDRDYPSPSPGQHPDHHTPSPSSSQSDDLKAFELPALQPPV